MAEIIGEGADRLNLTALAAEQAATRQQHAYRHPNEFESWILTYLCGSIGWYAVAELCWASLKTTVGQGGITEWGNKYVFTPQFIRDARLHKNSFRREIALLLFVEGFGNTIGLVDTVGVGIAASTVVIPAVRQKSIAVLLNPVKRWVAKTLIARHSGKALAKHIIGTGSLVLSVLFAYITVMDLVNMRKQVIALLFEQLTGNDPSKIIHPVLN